MKRKRYTEEPIGCVLRQAEAGTPRGKVCRKTGISEQTFSRWKKPVAGLGVDELRRLKQLEVESRRLKTLGAGPARVGDCHSSGIRCQHAGIAHTGMAVSSLCGLCETHRGSSRLTWRCPLIISFGREGRRKRCNGLDGLSRSGIESTAARYTDPASGCSGETNESARAGRSLRNKVSTMT